MISRIRRWWRIHIVANECAWCAWGRIEQVPGTRYAHEHCHWPRGASSGLFVTGWLCANCAHLLGVSEPNRDDR